MACFEGVVDRRMWWSNTEVDMFEGEIFRLNKYMSLNRFEEIIYNLSYTDRNVPRTMKISSTCARWKMHGMKT